MSALDDVLAERRRQDEKWGEQNHEPHGWLAILTEEIGEVAKEVADGLAASSGWREDDYRAELVQTTAVGLAALEAFDRGLWRMPKNLRWLGSFYLYRDSFGDWFVGRRRRDGSLVDMRIR